MYGSSIFVLFLTVRCDHLISLTMFVAAVEEEEEEREASGGPSSPSFACLPSPSPTLALSRPYPLSYVPYFSALPCPAQPPSPHSSSLLFLSSSSSSSSFPFSSLLPHFPLLFSLIPSPFFLPSETPCSSRLFRLQAVSYLAGVPSVGGPFCNPPPEDIPRLSFASADISLSLGVVTNHAPKCSHSYPSC